MPNTEKVKQTSSELEKLLKVFNSDNIIGKEEIDQVLEGIVTIIESFQKKSEEHSNQIKGQLAETLKQIADEHNAVLNQIQDFTQGSRKEVTEETQNHIKRHDKQVAKLIKEVKGLMPKDGAPGKDADEEVIIEKLLARIKLPEQKEVILDNGEEIVAKINELDTNDEAFKIDAKHIKNLPKSSKGKQSTGAIMHPPQITVSATPPPNPAINQLWVDIS